MTNYFSRFIPQYSELSTSLHQLTKKNVPWKWGEMRQQSFEHLKQMLSSKPIMTYFNAKKETTIITGAGPTGLSAILLQHTKHNTDYQVIAYSSRTLTSVEQRYSQIEKECLDILHGCEKFRLYLLGGHFTVLTDHKPLVTLLNNPNTTIPLRIERWSPCLQEYHFDINHIQGKFNPADYCSRHTTSTNKSVASIVTEAYLNFVLEHAKPVAISLDEIRENTKQDTTLI